uniref:Uracil nucleotide/cysteinyl leukotriene receptor n=1 Tax=Lepisosteus oculatus TaxID=7918 RepID=W5N0Y2_LEPOC
SGDLVLVSKTREIAKFRARRNQACAFLLYIDKFKKLFTSYYFLIFILAVPGNTLALWVFVYHKKNKTSTVFLRNLAVADTSYVMILPMRIVYHIMDSNWPFGEVLCRIVGFLFYLNMYCSLYFMTCISLDRFIAVVFPVKSLRLRKPLYANIISVTLWIILIITMFPLLISRQTIQLKNCTVCKQLYREQMSDRALVSLIVAFAIPLVTIVVSYLLIIHKLQKMHQENRPMKEKAFKMIILILANFLVAFVPYHINRVIYISAFNSKAVTLDKMAYLAFTNRITSSLTCISGVFDPVMYFFLTKTFQKSLMNLFCRKKTYIEEQISSGLLIQKSHSRK